MAEKRMFARSLIDSDAFLEMPLSAQALYFHLNMRADDDGFINNPKRITDYVGAAADDLKLLLAKRFIIVFVRMRMMMQCADRSFFEVVFHA
ncbi:DNA replication protein, partial [human gut metagenome]